MTTVKRMNSAYIAMVSFLLSVSTRVAAVSAVIIGSGIWIRPAAAQPVMEPIGPAGTETTGPATTGQLPPLPIEFNPENLINPGRPGGRRRGGASRGECEGEIPLTAVAYAASQSVQELGVSRTDESVGMATTRANPQLWFYMPAAVGKLPTEFVLKDSQNQVIYQGQLAGSTDTSGVVGVSLPLALRVNDAYQWFLTVDCDDSHRVTVNGWVERRSVNEDIDRTLRQASIQNRASLALSYGFLQDAVTAVATSRQTGSEQGSQDWAQLMSALGLPELSEATVLPCCELSDASQEDPVESLPVESPLEPEEMPEPTEAPEEESRSILQRARDRGN